MTDQHPITPPPELVEKWLSSAFKNRLSDGLKIEHVASQAARWGANQELEACCEWLKRDSGWDAIDVKDLIDYRRPILQNLKKQALGALSAIALGADDTREFYQDIETIKAALEALPDAD